MPLAHLSFGPNVVRIVLVALIATAISGCGRRGALEAPPGASGATAPSPRRELVSTPTTLATQQGGVVTDAPDSELDENAPVVAVSPSPTPRRRVRGYDVPKEPFILDALL